MDPDIYIRNWQESITGAAYSLQRLAEEHDMDNMQANQHQQINAAYLAIDATRTAYIDASANAARLAQQSEIADARVKEAFTAYMAALQTAQLSEQAHHTAIKQAMMEVDSVLAAARGERALAENAAFRATVRDASRLGEIRTRLEAAQARRAEYPEMAAFGQQAIDDIGFVLAEIDGYRAAFAMLRRLAGLPTESPNGGNDLLDWLKAAREAMTNEDIPVDEIKSFTEDEVAFGRDAWVYCRQHMKAHQTGWCTISARDKVGLGLFGHGTDTAIAARDKCREWDLPLYNDLYGEK